MSVSNVVYPTLISGIVGVIAAIGTVAIAGRWLPQGKATAVAEAKRAPKATTEHNNSRTIVVASDSQRMEALERELDELRKEKEGDDDPAPPDMDPEKSRRLAEERFAELDRRHAKDPPDPSWSPKATQDLESGLIALGEELGFAVQSAECKTTSCRATVEWGDYAKADDTGFELAQRAMPGLNCVQAIRLPEPNDPELPYTANLYLDCTGQRAGLVEVATNN